MMDYDYSLLEYVPADYDVKKIGFIVICKDSANDDMEIDFDLTPKQAPLDTSNSKCYICNRVYMNRSNLRRHLNTVHSENVYECDQCESKFTKQRQLTFHKRIHKAKMKIKKKSVCDICGREEKTHEKIELHMEIHQGLMDIDIEDIFSNLM